MRITRLRRYLYRRWRHLPSGCREVVMPRKVIVVQRVRRRDTRRRLKLQQAVEQVKRIQRAVLDNRLPVNLWEEGELSDGDLWRVRDELADDVGRGRADDTHDAVQLVLVIATAEEG